MQADTYLRICKANRPTITNPQNEILYFVIFQKEKLHIFLVYIHNKSRIEQSLFNIAIRQKFAIITGDLNLTNPKRREQFENSYQTLIQ